MTPLFQLRQGLNHSSLFRTFSSIFSLEIVERAYENKNRGGHIDRKPKGWGWGLHPRPRALKILEKKKHEKHLWTGYNHSHMMLRITCKEVPTSLIFPISPV